MKDAFVYTCRTLSDATINLYSGNTFLPPKRQMIHPNVSKFHCGATVQCIARYVHMAIWVLVSYLSSTCTICFHVKVVCDWCTGVHICCISVHVDIQEYMCYAVLITVQLHWDHQKKNSRVTWRFWLKTIARRSIDSRFPLTPPYSKGKWSYIRCMHTCSWDNTPVLQNSSF